MNDLTVIYYTANLVDDFFAKNIRARLLQTIGDTPVISVSQVPIDFGRNLCVGRHRQSEYGIFRSIFIGALTATTPYIACAEDDVVYTKEHFAHRPPNLETFSYNINRWQLNSDKFFWRHSISMGMCIAPTEALVINLARRFAFINKGNGGNQLWSEPGLREAINGLPTVSIQKFRTVSSQVMVNRVGSLGGKRNYHLHDSVVDELPGVGLATTLWENLHAQR